MADMRVLFVLPRMVAGGVERATLNLIAGLQQHGVDCRLALGHCRGELLDEARRLVAVDEVAIHGDILFVTGLLPVLRRYRPTHVVTAFADVSLMTMMASRLVRCRAAIVVGVHGTHRKAAASGGWRAFVQYHTYGRLAGIVYRNCDAIVAVSDGVASDVRERYPHGADRLVMIHNPVVGDAMRERLVRLPHRKERKPPFRLVALGRLAHEKGFDVLLRALPLIVAHHDVRLVIHGEGAERRYLQALIDTLGLQAQACLMGNTSDPLSALSDADVFVFPSRHEGFGVALVEALACGCQVVASDCPHGPAEILRHGKLGQLVPPGDSAALAQAICRSLTGEVLFDEAALRLRAEDYSAGASVSQYLTLLQRLSRACR